MLRVVIADDEVKVIQLIELLVDWSSFDMQIISRVKDGQKALDLILKEKPDIVITDIRMPSLNGIELVERVHEADLHPYFVIISGFSEFEYAQKGIQLGVEDYLLKPLKKKDLESVLHKIQAKHQKMNQTDAEKDSLIDQLKESQKRVKSSFLTDVLIQHLSSPLMMSPDQIDKKYGCQLISPQLRCLVTHIYTDDIRNTSENQEQVSFILPKILEILESLLTPLCDEVISIIGNYEVITLIGYSAEDPQMIYEALGKLKNSFINYRSIYSSLHGVIGISKPFTSIRMLVEGYQDAERMLFGRFNREGTFLLLSQDCGIDTKYPGIAPSYRKTVSTKIELLDAEGFCNAAEKYFDYIRYVSDNASAVQSAWSSLCETVIYGIRLFPDAPEDISATAEELSLAIERIYSLESLRELFIQSACKIIEQFTRVKQALEDKPIRDAKKYIQEHYSEPITLETVSHEVGFNPAYLSTVFKKSTGQNFLEYVKEVRIEKAKDLLVRTNMSPATIASAVGYTDLKYFTRLFHKATNLTLNDYRKLYG